MLNRCERTVEHREDSAEIERYFGDGLVWRSYLPNPTVLQGVARHSVLVQRITGQRAAEVGEVFTELVGHTRMAGVSQ